MAGIAGAVIGLASGAQPPIAGDVAIADATTSGRGCTTNFIGFGLGATSQEPLPEDFSAADDSVALAITAGATYAPTYTAIPGNTRDKTLTWVDTTPP
jgi:hypothetical protein